MVRVRVRARRLAGEKDCPHNFAWHCVVLLVGAPPFSDPSSPTTTVALPRTITTIPTSSCQAPSSLQQLPLSNYTTCSSQLPSPALQFPFCFHCDPHFSLPTWGVRSPGRVVRGSAGSSPGLRNNDLEGKEGAGSEAGWSPGGGSGGAGDSGEGSSGDASGGSGGASSGGDQEGSAWVTLMLLGGRPWVSLPDLQDRLRALEVLDALVGLCVSADAQGTCATGWHGWVVPFRCVSWVGLFPPPPVPPPRRLGGFRWCKPEAVGVAPVLCW